MTPELLLLAVSVAGYTAGALAALAFRGMVARALVAAGALGGSLATLALGAWCLATGATLAFAAPWLPLTGLALRADGLSAFFLIVVGLAAAAASLYGFGYSAQYDGRYSLRLLGAMFNVLLLSLAIQVLADNALTFLVTWEAMSLSAYLLVLVEHDQHGTVRAANWYLAVTHAGFAALVAAFLVLAGGDMTGSFAAMRSATLPPATRNVVFLLALVGFGTKAGVIPLHVWLPMAHPVAPSHVSALLSGVVIKMGVYGLMRVALDLLGGGPPWWGVGGGLMFQSYGLPGLATLGFIAGLYHTINHACFKGLLFLGAGSVLYATR